MLPELNIAKRTCLPQQWPWKGALWNATTEVPVQQIEKKMGSEWSSPGSDLSTPRFSGAVWKRCLMKTSWEDLLALALVLKRAVMHIDLLKTLHYSDWEEARSWVCFSRILLVNSSQNCKNLIKKRIIFWGTIFWRTNIIFFQQQGIAAVLCLGQMFCLGQIYARHLFRGQFLLVCNCPLLTWLPRWSLASKLGSGGLEFQGWQWLQLEVWLLGNSRASHSKMVLCSWDWECLLLCEDSSSCCSSLCCRLRCADWNSPLFAGQCYLLVCSGFYFSSNRRATSRWRCCSRGRFCGRAGYFDPQMLPLDSCKQGDVSPKDFLSVAMGSWQVQTQETFGSGVSKNDWLHRTSDQQTACSERGHHRTASKRQGGEEQPGCGAGSRSASLEISGLGLCVAGSNILPG